MTATLAESGRRSAAGPRIRVAYRSAAGQVHLDWPAERIAEAVADAEGTVWVDVEDPIPDPDRAEVLFRDVFHFHPLAIEDALQETHVSKVDDWESYLYLVFHSVEYLPEKHSLRLHELDVFLGHNYLVTYHLRPVAPLEQLRRNLERDEGRRLEKGPDHLLYQALDLSIGDYFGAIEHLDDAIDAIQDEVFAQPSPRTLRQIFQIKRAALRLHRILIPQREVLNRLARDPYPQIDAQDRVYFRDVYDHLVRLHDISETLRDLIAGALDTYLSAISNRTNEVMKTLTLVNVMFLPMSFFAGFFGMNFFGETLAFKTALPKALLFCLTCTLMVATPGAMWIWARRRGWF